MTERPLELPDDLELPRWCEGSRLAYSFEIGQETPSNNVIRGMAPKAYMALRQLWQVKVFSRGLSGRRPSAPLRRAALVVVRRSAGELDWDNAYGGLKPVLDCLVVESRKNPSGLGLVADDSPKHMPYPPWVVQRKAPPGRGTAHIAIFDLERIGV